MKKDKSWLGIGAIGGTIALLCCVSPVVLVLLGLSTATVAIALGNNLFSNYKLYFIGASLLFMAGAITYKLKKQNQCSISGVRKNLNKILLTMIIGIVVYIFWYIFTTWLGNLGGA
jgi:uncharacterized membrane protein